MFPIMPTDSPTIPRLAVDQMQFCETHVPVWTANAAAIGVTPLQVSELATLTDAAKDAFAAMQAARLASLAATQTFHNAVDAMRGQAADLVMIIRTHAQVTDDVNVYAKAEIHPPAARSPASPPGTPTGVTTALNGDGSITLRWKSKGSAPSTGAFFEVQRKLAGESAFTTVGGVAARTFTDSTIPVGAASASYIITGSRGRKRSEGSAQVAVQFGGGVNGVAGARARMAA